MILDDLRYFGTFSRTLLTMFECLGSHLLARLDHLVARILFANWGPPCRVLIEAVNEWCLGDFFSSAKNATGLASSFSSTAAS